MLVEWSAVETVERKEIVQVALMGDLQAAVMGDP